MLTASSLLLRPAAAAELFGISLRTILKWHQGLLPAPDGFPPPVKLGESLRWRVSDLETYVVNMSAASTSAIPPLPTPAALAAADAAADAPTAPRRGRGRPRKLGGAK